MGSFDNDVLNGVDNELLSLCQGGYKVSLFGGKIAVLEGHKGINLFDKERMVFRLKSGVIEIGGHDLFLKQLTADFAVICGEINQVEVMKNI